MSGLTRHVGSVRASVMDALRQRRHARPGYIATMRELNDSQRAAIGAYVAALNSEASAYRVDARERDELDPTTSPRTRETNNGLRATN